MKSEIEKIRDVIIAQAKYFLADAGEFYPFGSILKPNGNIVPIGVYLENDHPDSSEVLQILQNSIEVSLKNGEAIVAGIGLDVLYKPEGGLHKSDAIKIVIFTNEGHSLDYIVIYNKDGDNFTFGLPFLDDGKLKLN